MNIYTKSYKEKSLKSCSSTLNAYIIFLTSIQTSTLCKLGYNSCFAKLYYVHSRIKLLEIYEVLEFFSSFKSSCHCLIKWILDTVPTKQILLKRNVIFSLDQTSSVYTIVLNKLWFICSLVVVGFHFKIWWQHMRGGCSGMYSRGQFRSGVKFSF